MSEENKKKKLDDIVKSKIKGLGLDALFHQVDVSQKDEETAKKPSSALDKTDAHLMHKLKNSVPLINRNKKLSAIFENIRNSMTQKKTHKIIFDIGSDALKIAVFKYTKDQLVLTDLHHLKIPYIASMTQDKKEKFLKESLLKISAELPLGSAFISSILPRNNVIVKFLNLPSTHTDEIKKMLNFEAEQHLPFALSDLEIDHQIISKKPPETKIMLVAARKSEIARHLQFFKNTNIDPHELTISSGAIFSCGFASFKEEGTYIQVHIGATFTDVNIVENKSLKFCRSINAGSRDLTLRIAKNLNIPFADAENIKKENGIVLTKGTRNQTEKQISDTICNWADELISEIKHSIDSFKITSGSIDIKQVILSGGASRLKNLNEYFKDRLKIKTTLEKPVSVSDNPQLQDRYLELFHELSPALGLKETAMKINLLPKSIKLKIKSKEENKKRIIVTLLVASIAILFLLIPSWLLRLREKQIIGLNDQLELLEPQIATVDDLNSKIKAIEDYISTKNSCMEILRELSIITSFDITIDNFSFEKDKSVILIGTALSHSSVVSFSQRLNESEAFDDAKILYTRKNLTLGAEIVDFEIFCGIDTITGEIK